MPQIPVARPKLPSAERIAPYLAAIDAQRYYSNFGPLVSSFEERVAEHYGLPAGSATTVANGTWGLVLALAAQGARPGSLCAMPAWTFVASAHAVLGAGLVPFFIDVDPQTWAIEPAAVRDEVRRAPAPVGAVMPVLPFGQPIDVASWDAFRSETGIAVVIDAAAGFDALTPGETPAVVSLHATKVLASGEGGLVLSSDRSLVREIRKRSNFGFLGAREASVAATNAKMSEYHAAVGHASLDEWKAIRADWVRVAAAYRAQVGASNRMRLQKGFGETWVASTCCIAAPGAANEIERALAGKRIDTRRWWGAGVHVQPFAAEYPRAPLPITEELAASTVGLPFYRDLPLDTVEEIVGVVRSIVGA